MKVLRLFLIAAIVCSLMAAVPGFAQSITSGDIAGVVTDPSGAVVPNAKVIAKNDATGASETVTTNGEGFYRFSFLQPGSYTISTNAPGFQPGSRKIQVAVGQAANGNIALSLTASTTTVEVTAVAPSIQSETPSVSTTFSQEQVTAVPNPGNDLSAIAQTSPGTTMNTQGGFGNFSTFGLPGTSNLFTLNGMNDNDPFLNLNNSGATNLLLGANDIQEVTVINNAYAGQYGQLAGSQVNYVTKSGGNQWHGNAQYFWNGRVLNANDYRNNFQIQGNPSTPKPFDNVNQWAANISGPIVKDKTFFSWNYEGLRVVLPTQATVFVPTQAFETATINNLNANGLAASVPFYQNIFSLFNAGAAGKTLTPITTSPGGCSNIDPTLIPGGICAQQFSSNPNTFTHEYQMSLRIDQIFSDKDKIFGRVQTDRGLQATFTDAINPAFNVFSNQPEYQGQLNWTHVFSPNLVNEFNPSGTWYTAIFNNANRAAALSTFPTTIDFADGSLGQQNVAGLAAVLGGQDFACPQGRNVTQYQLVDDVSWVKGKHSIKFGANFRRYDVTDSDYSTFSTGLLIPFSLDDFFNGGNGTAQTGFGDQLIQKFLSRPTQPMAYYGLGVFLQDEWRATNKLKLTFALRLDLNSNPVCQTDCFAEFTAPFTSLNHDPNVPYNQIIKTGLSQAYPGTDIVVWQPRFGFTWSPFANNKTVVSGGIGIFTDSFPAIIVDSFSSNSPVVNTFNIFNLPLSPAQNPATGGNLFSAAGFSNNGFNTGFASGQTAAGINNAILAATGGNVGFTPPNFFASDPRIRQPRYQEWNFQIQRDLGWNTALAVNYVGNHGIFEGIQNPGVNAFFPTGFGNLPTTAPDPRFSVVTQVQSIATSNYNGLTASVRHNFSHGVAFGLNYTWSHAFDDISNGGNPAEPYNPASSISFLENPFNLRANYGPADYDIRHYFSANYVWDNSLRHLFHWGPNAIFGGWTFSGTIFSRSGLPFTVVNGLEANTLSNDNFGGPVFANVIGQTTSGSCGKANATPNPATGNIPPCLLTSGFTAANAQTAFGNQGRNSFRGPNYFDTDFTVMKYTTLGGERAPKLGIGFQFFNLLNHANFNQPVVDIHNGSFGQIISTVSTPTSILGSFLGGDASPRLIQLKAELKF
jgi:hypothetical protein